MQPRQKRLDAIDAGKDQPIIAFDFFYRGIESGKKSLRRLNFDRRKLYDFAAQFFDGRAKLSAWARARVTTIRLPISGLCGDSSRCLLASRRHLNTREQLARASFQKLLR